MTDRYAVVGNPIAHSKSPEIHDAFARATGHDLTYERLLAPLDGFVATVEAFAREGGLGANVTVPFKLEAFVLARERSARADKAGACNTLARRGDHWYGDNTDGVGVVRDLTHNLGVALGGRDLLVLGAGGATRGILGPLLAEKPRSLVIANRTLERAALLATMFAADGPIRAAGVDAVGAQRFDVVIDATSAALAQLAATDATAALPWPTTIFARDALAYDLKYAAQPTPFLRWASAHGAGRSIDGLGMLIEQAAESFAIWRGVRPPTAPVFAMLRPS